MLERQTVAGFDFDRRHAFGEQLVETRQAFGHELLFACRARGINRRENAAAAGRDLLVRHAVQTLHEFAGAVAGVDEMGVAVDESRRDEPALAVGVLRGGEIAGRFGSRAGVVDEPVMARDEAVVDEAQALAVREGRKASVSPNAVTVHGGTL